MTQVHLANDDPLSALDDAMAVLKNNPEDFTTLCIKVIYRVIWAQQLIYFFSGSLLLLSWAI